MAIEAKINTRPDQTGVAAAIGWVNGQIAGVAFPSLTQFALRLALGVPFWRSGINKWEGFLQLNDVAVLLFASEFRLHLPGGPYSYPFPAATAFLSGSAEILLPLLLLAGLFTRVAAVALLLMTILIQLTVPDGWPLHLTWAAMALAIMAWGPGRWSLDHALFRRNA